MPHIRYQVFFKNPVYLTILLSLVISCPYVPFVDGTLLAERIASGVLFSTFIVGVAYLMKKSRVIAAILTILVVTYLFVSYCEVGNFLVMGQSFNTEFWQFFDMHAIKLVMDTAPFLFWRGIIFLVLIVFSLFQAILNMNRYNNRTKWSLSLIPAIMLIGLASNAKYSSFTQMTEAYIDYSQIANIQDKLGKRKQPGKKQIFHTKDPHVFSHLDQMKYISQNNFEVYGGDPKMYMNLPLSENSSHLLVVDMESPDGGIAQIYYELNGEPYCELNSSKSFITAGKNTVSFFLSKGAYNERLRFDIGVKPGIYKFGSMKLYALEIDL